MLYLFDLLRLNANGWLYMQYQETRLAVYFIAGILLCIAVPYILGSLNFAIIISKYKYGDDIRNHGSGNAGLTNMQRVYGKEGGLLTFAGDISKQLLSVWFGMFIFGENGAYIAGTFCVLGHIFPAFYRFKGGKGVLTAATMVLLLDPVSFLFLIVIFVLIVAVFRYISLGSVLAGFCYPAVINFKRLAMTGGEPTPTPVLIFSVFIGLLIIVMHRENLKRLYYNEEPKFSFKKKEEEEAEPVREQNHTKKKKKRK